MALSQSIVWTTLPYGRISVRGQSALRVSVMVSPRLTPTAQEVLKPFDLFLDWPKYATELKFKLVFDGGPSGELLPLREQDPLDSVLWRKLFDAETYVRGHAFTDLKNEIVRSYPSSEVVSYLQEMYGETAQKHGTEFPSRVDAESPLTRLKRELGPLSEPHMRDRLNKMYERSLKESKVMPPNSERTREGRALYTFFQAQRFYNRTKKPGSNAYQASPVDGFVPTPVERPDFDFHQAVSAFGDYPRLMRRLGLVLDFVWLESAGVAPQGKVRVDLAWGDPAVLPSWHVADKPAWTAYALTGEDFRARAAAGPTAELTVGQLDLREVQDIQPDKQKSAYMIAQLDVDGSALKTLHTAGTLVRLDNKQVTNYRTPERSDLPALRTSGLSLYRRERARAAHGQLVRAAQVQSQFLGASRPTFTADDLVRGYRIDIWDDVSEEWHSLCLREGEYRFSKKGKLELRLRDEGYVKASSAARGEDGVEKDLYLHERLAAFDGWSLVASRPGKTLAKDPSETEPAVPNEDPAKEFGLATRFYPPAGSVPRLRYGRTYRMRVRIVDVAGNSQEFEKADDKAASQPFLFARYEPVPSPTLLLRERVTEGESLEHLVIRSDFDRTATAYASDPAVEEVLEAVRDRLDLTGADRAAYAYRAENDRHVAPPKISQLEAETHGKFDEFMGPGKDHAKGYRLALRESATFLSRTMVNLATGAEEAIPGLQLETVAPTGKTRTDLDDPDRNPGDALQEGEYVLHREANLVVPYLADPFAAGVAFVGLPGMPAGEPFFVKFEGTWPDVQPFRIQIVERSGVLNQCAQVFADDGAPKWDGLNHVLNVFQAKGVTSEVRYSCVLPSADAIRTMGLWKWLEQRGGVDLATRKAIASGKHWMFTPWRTMTLVHAVQHPLCAPTIKTFAPSRLMGDTFAKLRGTWHLSIKSTAKVDVLAACNEPLDDPAQPTWQILERSGHVAELKMNPAYADDLEVPPLMYPEKAEFAAVARLRLPLQHEFGDTKHRIVRYRLKGTTRFREYFPVELTHHEEAITRTGEEFVVSIPSSARPVAARPLYVLPTFRWEQTDLPNNGLIRTRRGNGLRVYLERPWWSSGESERLGVVFKAGGIDSKSPLKPYVTQWGLDPAFDSAAPVAGPTLAAFPLAVNTRSNVSLHEHGDDQDIFAVAGHSVEFDPVRKLWFSDLVIKAGASYFPFVRLALARFQPFSIDDCHLSRVVLTDFVQLVPDRTLDVRWISANKVRVKIFGVAPTETFASRVLGSLMQVRRRSGTDSAVSQISDILSEPLSGAQVLQAFKPGVMEELKPGAVVQQPGIAELASEPAAASKRPGLNEYTVTVERLPEGGSTDFSWTEIEGVKLTKPPTPKSSPKPFDPQITTGIQRKGKGAIAAGARSQPTRAGKLAATSKVSAAGKLKATDSLVDVVTGGVSLEPSFQIAPLWEADVTLPATSDSRPRRLVVKESELYFKATPQPKEFLPIARRLVYVDIVDLPAPVA